MVNYLLVENDFSFNLSHHSSKYYKQNRTELTGFLTNILFFQNRIFWMKYSKIVTIDIQKYLLLTAQENVKV